MNQQSASVQMNTRLGNISVRHKNLYTFEEGLYGFSDAKTFVLSSVPTMEESSPFFMMQSLDHPDLCFVVLNCNVDVNDEVHSLPSLIFKEDLELVSKELNIPVEHLQYGFITSMNEGTSMTANIMAPLFFNKNDKTGYQLILKNPMYQIAQPLN